MLFISYCFTYFLSNCSYLLIGTRLKSKLLNSKFNIKFFYIFSILLFPILFIKTIFKTTNFSNNLVKKNFTPPSYWDMDFFINRSSEENKSEFKDQACNLLYNKNDIKWIYLIGDSHAVASAIMFQNIEKDSLYRIVGIRLSGLYTELMMRDDLEYNLYERSNNVYKYLDRNLKANEVILLQINKQLGLANIQRLFSDHNFILKIKKVFR